MIDSKALRGTGFLRWPSKLRLLTAIGIASLAGMLFGIDTAVIAGVTGSLTTTFNLSPQTLGVTVSAALWGTLGGTVFAGRTGDRFGSRNVLRVLGLFYVFSSLGCALTASWPLFLVLRFMCGLAIGGSSVLAPVYIAEISPASRRGILVGLFQLLIVCGILVAYVSNALVSWAVVEDAWRWKLGVTAVPALLFVLLMLFIPNSPRWLVTRGKKGQAAATLLTLGFDNEEIADELHRADVELQRDPGGEHLSFQRHLRPMLLAVLVAMFNQLAGINAVLYYLNDILLRAGSFSPDRQAITIGLANLIFTLAGMALIDRIGRKTLLLIGSVGMAICLTGAAAVLHGLLSDHLMLYVLIGFIAFFAVSQGAVIWVYISEVFPTSVRARGSALGAGTHWLMNAVIAVAFPIVSAWSIPAPFEIFAVAMVVQFLVVLFYFPETRGMNLEELSKRLVRP